MTTDTTPTTVVELPAEWRGNPMRKKLNAGVLVAWINRDLLNRANIDMRTSFVFYDVDGIFEYALNDLPDAEQLQKLHDQLGWRYYSEGLA